jgi:hypothetical protein
MKVNRITLLASAAAVAGVMLAAAPASAYVVCNGGDCWYTHDRYTVPNVTFDWHPDDWYFHQHWDADHHWHDIHNGRGYWKGGVWIGL